jgi:hypothetical protein
MTLVLTPKTDVVVINAATGQSRVAAGDPLGQGGYYAGWAGLWLFVWQVVMAELIRAAANRPQAQRQEIAARGGKPIERENLKTRRDAAESARIWGHTKR